MSRDVATSVEARKNSGKNEKNGDLIKKILDQDEEELTIEDLAPEGGWGYVIAVAMIIVNVALYCAGASFNLVFGDFLEATGQPGAAMTVLNSCFMLSFAVTGLMTDAIVNRYGMRVVGLTAAFIFCIPNVLSAFVTHLYQLAIFFFIQGIGSGLMNTICNATFNAYFVRRRSQVMSAAQVVVGLVATIYPIIIGEMMQFYGFRSTVALIGGVSCNCIVGMLLMHPVEQHLKDPNVVREERSRLRAEKLELANNKPIKKLTAARQLSDRRATVHETRVSMEQSRWSSLGNLKEDQTHCEPLLVTPLKSKGSISDLRNRMRPRSISSASKVALTQQLASSSASSFGNLVGALAESQKRAEIIYHPLSQEKTEDSGLREIILKKSDDQDVRIKSIPDVPEKNKGLNIFTKLSEICQLSLLKNRTFAFMTLGVSFAFASDITFSSLFALEMNEHGYEKKNIATTVTTTSAAELFSRITFALVMAFFNFRPKTVFYFAMLAMAIVKLAYFYFSSSLLQILICIIAIGIVRTCIYVPQPLIVVENFPVEMYTVAYGVFTLVNGITIIVIGPIVGLIKDVAGFSVAQLVLIGINSAFILPWTYELIVDYRNAKKKTDPTHENE